MGFSETPFLLFLLTLSVLAYWKSGGGAADVGWRSCWMLFSALIFRPFPNPNSFLLVLDSFSPIIFLGGSSVHILVLCFSHFSSWFD